MKEEFGIHNDEGRDSQEQREKVKGENFLLILTWILDSDLRTPNSDDGVKSSYIANIANKTKKAKQEREACRKVTAN